MDITMLSVISTFVWHQPNTLANIVRDIAIGGCLLVLGMNLSVIHRPPISPPNRFTAWRLFFIGKSMMTLYVAIDLMHTHVGAIHWRPPYVLASLVVVQIALLQLWKSWNEARLDDWDGKERRERKS
jgi:hypothetical protein